VIPKETALLFARLTPSSIWNALIIIGITEEKTVVS
jgi:hypothetical protein